MHSETVNSQLTTLYCIYAAILIDFLLLSYYIDNSEIISFTSLSYLRVIKNMISKDTLGIFSEKM